MTTIHICTASDNNYAQHAGVMMASVLKNSNNDEDFVFHILDGGIGEKEKKNIEELKKIKNFEIKYYQTNNDDFKDCPIYYTDSACSIATYYRFLIANYLENIDKVLYLDCDTVITTTLKPLWDVDLTNHVIAGVEDPISEANKKRLDIPSEYFYFNAGVLLINLKKWREDDIQKFLFDYVKNHFDKIKWQDQDILNDVLYKKSLQLPLKWNSMYYAYENTYKDQSEYKEALENPCIIHYITADKPWNYNSQVPRKECYWDILKLTPWYKVYNTYCKKQRLKHLIISFLKFLARYPFFFLSKKRIETFKKIFK